MISLRDTIYLSFLLTSWTVRFSFVCFESTINLYHFDEEGLKNRVIPFHGCSCFCSFNQRCIIGAPRGSLDCPCFFAVSVSFIGGAQQRGWEVSYLIKPSSFLGWISKNKCSGTEGTETTDAAFMAFALSCRADIVSRVHGRLLLAHVDNQMLLDVDGIDGSREEGSAGRGKWCRESGYEKEKARSKLYSMLIKQGQGNRMVREKMTRMNAWRRSLNLLSSKFESHSPFWYLCGLIHAIAHRIGCVVLAWRQQGYSRLCGSITSRTVVRQDYIC